MARKVSNNAKRRVTAARPPSNIGSPLDLYEIFVEGSKIKEPKKTQAGLLELALWPPHQGERGTHFPLWCDLRFDCLEEPFDGKWRIKVYLTRAELIANFTGCSPARGTLYGDHLLAPDETVIEQELQETDVSGSAELSAEVRGTTVRGLFAGLKGYIKRIKNTRLKTASRLNTKVKHQRVANVPAQGSGKVWQIKDPRHRILQGTYLRAPAEDEPRAPPLCKIVLEADSFELSLGLEVRSSDIDFEIVAIDRTWALLWRRKERPNPNSIVKLLISKSFVEDFSYDYEGRHRIASARLWGIRKALDAEGNR